MLYYKSFLWNSCALTDLSLSFSVLFLFGLHLFFFTMFGMMLFPRERTVSDVIYHFWNDFFPREYTVSDVIYHVWYDVAST